MTAIIYSSFQTSISHYEHTLSQSLFAFKVSRQNVHNGYLLLTCICVEHFLCRSFVICRRWFPSSDVGAMDSCDTAFRCFLHDCVLWTPRGLAEASTLLLRRSEDELYILYLDNCEIQNHCLVIIAMNAGNQHLLVNRGQALFPHGRHVKYQGQRIIV